MNANQRHTVGTLHYTLRQLAEVFFWLSIGNFGMVLLGCAIGTLLPLTSETPEPAICCSDFWSAVFRRH